MKSSPTTASLSCYAVLITSGIAPDYGQSFYARNPQDTPYLFFRRTEAVALKKAYIQFGIPARKLKVVKVIATITPEV